MKRLTFLFSLCLLSVLGVQAQKNWSWQNFIRPEGVNPVISPDPAHRWECSDTFNPAATTKEGKIIVLYRAEDNSAVGIGKRTSCIGYAESADGLHFTRRPEPVLQQNPADDQYEHEQGGGCEDPRVVKTEDGSYVMLYTQWNRKQARLACATSSDLLAWQKHGSVFSQAYGGRFVTLFTKSASIVQRVNAKGELVAAKIHGKYWMYWGERFVNVATSDDLIHWTPMLDEKGELLHVIEPRKGYFDSQLTECGPPAILTEQGIILFYNGKNDGKTGDPAYTANSYCAGQILFSAQDPAQVLDRLDKPFFQPESDFEKSGQYPDGTVFIEGLVPYQGKWYLYYGCADSRVSVAVKSR